MNTLDKVYRYEIKYLISKEVKERLVKKLSLIMKKDNHYDDKYNIKSLYFDDIYNNAYIDKLDGIIEREKYRIRIYNDKDDFISLELKGKNNTLTYKSRCDITVNEYYDILNKKYDNINVDNRELLKIFINDIKGNNLLPKVIVNYDRLAFTYHLNTRITFDYNIRSGINSNDLFGKVNYLSDLSDYIILEVKYDKYFPKVLKDILESEKLERISISKYAMCMDIKGV